MNSCVKELIAKPDGWTVVSKNSLSNQMKEQTGLQDSKLFLNFYVFVSYWPACATNLIKVTYFLFSRLLRYILGY